MKNISKILPITFVLFLATDVMSQQTLIKELPASKSLDIITEIESRQDVLAAYPIAIDKDILFTGDTLFKILLYENEINISKEHLNLRDINSFSFYGKNNTNCLLLSVINNDIQGVLTLNNHSYSIETHRGEYYLVCLDNNALQEDCNDLNAPNNQQSIDNNAQTNEVSDVEDTQSQILWNRFHDGSGDIKVLVLYTQNAANSVSNIVNTTLLAEELSNQSFVNSGINCKIELVYIGKTNYIETNSLSDVTYFKKRDDGYIDEVHILREKYAADVCVLLTNYNFATCGRADTIKANDSNAFCVVQALTCATAWYSFIHEIGHLVGCRHDYGNDVSNNPYEFGHGYINPNKTWRTIMAYGNNCNYCDRINYWSNPFVTYEGEPMGTEDRCNNVKVWNSRYYDVGTFENPSNNIAILSNTIQATLDYGFIEAGNNIWTNGYVNLQNGQSLAIKAGSEISFYDGFLASVGSELNAFISPSSSLSYVGNPTSQLLEVTPVRQNDANHTERITRIYPNPTTTNLQIQNKEGEIPEKISIFNFVGEKVIADIYTNSTSTEISLLNIPSGIYFVDIKYKDKCERYKIIKK